MKWLSISWTVVVNLITVGVVGGIISSLEYETSMQTIAALIVFAYINLNNSITSVFRSQLQLAIFSAEQNAQIIKSIPSGDEDEATDLENDAKDAQKALTDTNVKYYINLVGNTLIWIICIATLLGNL